MFLKPKRKFVWVAVASAAALIMLGLFFADSTSRIKIASGFSTQDVRAIRREVSRMRWEEFRNSVAALDSKRFGQRTLPIVFSWTETIAGSPGPPGGAFVGCRGIFSGTECTFMVSNSTNGWKCRSMGFTDAATMRKVREAMQEVVTAHP